MCMRYYKRHDWSLAYMEKYSVANILADNLLPLPVNKPPTSR